MPTRQRMHSSTRTPTSRFRRDLLCTLLAAAISTAALAQEAQRVTFETSDNVNVVGDYYAPKQSVEPAPMAILLHQYQSDRSSWQPLIAPLHEKGFAILAIDLRGHGESGNEEHRQEVEKKDDGVFRAMEKDLLAAYGWLAKQTNVDRTRFALVGASVGCSLALDYAGNDPSVDAVVCLTPGEKYMGLNSLGDVRRLYGRKLLFVATEDERKAADKLKDIADKGAKSAPQGAAASEIEVRVPEGSAHGTAMFGTVSGIEQQLAEWLRQAVGGMSETPIYTGWKHKKFYKDRQGAASLQDDQLRMLTDEQEGTRRGLQGGDPPPIKVEIG